MSDPLSAIAAYVERPFGTFAALFALQAQARPDHPAIICGDRTISYRELDALADRIAASLQRDGVGPGGAVAICATASIDYAAVFIATLRTGAAIAPLAPSATAEQLRAMLGDCDASHLFSDTVVTEHLAPVAGEIAAQRIALDAGAAGTPLADWMAAEGAKPVAVEVEPDQPFNIIYSSGTTGTPKGIVQSYRMRWPHNHLVNPPGYGPAAVAMISTPLYSNTTLVSFIPALAGGGTVVLMPKFDARTFLELSQRHGATHAMLVPVQYRRILDVPDFDSFDLSTYVMKFATSAPFPAELKTDVLARWPGGLIEYYGMTEGGGSCMLIAHEHPDKLGTVGQPMPGHDIRVIDNDGRVLPAGEVGEVVGRSAVMMNGYHNRPEQTAEAEWRSPEGDRFIRTGDLAVVDEDGFFTLIGRKKDLIISGGINIYPVDLEEALLEHPAVREAAVVGARSREWGETPVGFVTLLPGEAADGDTLKAFANSRLGKMQRLADVRVVDELPRSAIGKILKRELQDRLSVETAQFS
jgi:acyl-CoA synthetase (AMP-forming)/AMP-acid ligase II